MYHVLASSTAPASSLVTYVHPRLLGSNPSLIGYSLLLSRNDFNYVPSVESLWVYPSLSRADYLT